MKAVGEVLKNERRNRFGKITQESISQLIGVSQEQYCRIENGKGRLGIIELHIICNRFGLTLTELAFKVEHYLKSYSLLAPKRKSKFQRWVKIYNEYSKDPFALSDDEQEITDSESAAMNQ